MNIIIIYKAHALFNTAVELNGVFDPTTFTIEWNLINLFEHNTLELSFEYVI